MSRVVPDTMSEYESSDRFYTGLEKVGATLRMMRSVAAELDLELCFRRGVPGKALVFWQWKDGRHSACVLRPAESVGGSQLRPIINMGELC